MSCALMGSSGELSHLAGRGFIPIDESNLVDPLDPGAAVPAWHHQANRQTVVWQQRFASDLMLRALALNAVLFAASYWLFQYLLESARRKGSLIQMGE